MGLSAVGLGSFPKLTSEGEEPASQAHREGRYHRRAPRPAIVNDLRLMVGEPFQALSFFPLNEHSPGCNRRYRRPFTPSIRGLRAYFHALDRRRAEWRILQRYNFCPPATFRCFSVMTTRYSVNLIMSDKLVNGLLSHGTTLLVMSPLTPLSFALEAAAWKCGRYLHVILSCRL